MLYVFLIHEYIMLVAFPTRLCIDRNSIALLITHATGKGLILMILYKSELYNALHACCIVLMLLFPTTFGEIGRKLLSNDSINNAVCVITKIKNT